MKKHFVFILTGVILVSFLTAQDFDIRRLNWGMSYEQVQTAEELKDNLYKEEELLGIKVETIFGFHKGGLNSVTYTTRKLEFGEQVKSVLINKYGTAQSELDFSYLISVKHILKKYPGVVIKAYEKDDFADLEKSVKSSDEQKIIRAALSKRDKWQDGKTIALLLNSPVGVVLSYWSASYHQDSQKKAEAFIAELKKMVKKKTDKKKEDTDKFF